MTKPRIRVPARPGVRGYDYLVHGKPENRILFMRVGDFDSPEHAWKEAVKFCETGRSPYPRPHQLERSI